ncbi:DUF423 domain-containing protein [Photobacterium ganghwense]|uniref:Membrane protein n=1 Tax=Photobacterium ganghwense TaxID=320778 RepID=A0A0J1HJJ4_9GAMM|nr:DUF423 domain-containing protein [Photobacterium ganghwense]KLV11741.1 membrane protein [Photobacterium ganghwense]PSU04600.1 DUF423 domain-containing protein [Photobacterium ganghwense]QSV14620.1 DUF423 domain-containing protein [Photobacterium ganghwense]
MNNQFSRWILVLAALSGAVAVALGAFAAHGLKARLDPNLLDIFKTGVQYQAWHSLAVIGCVILARILPSKAVLYAALFFIAGILMFSGSLYGLALTGMKWLGPITPMGGVCFIIGWVVLAVAAWRSA